MKTRFYTPSNPVLLYTQFQLRKNIFPSGDRDYRFLMALEMRCSDLLFLKLGLYLLSIILEAWQKFSCFVTCYYTLWFTKDIENWLVIYTLGTNILDEPGSARNSQIRDACKLHTL